MSALIADGPPSRLVQLAIDGEVELIVPAPVLRELERVVKPKRGINDERWIEARDLLDGIAPDRPESRGVVEPVTGDPGDNEIFACTLEAGADLLVSGDRRHLLPIGVHRGLRIVTPQSLPAELLA